MPTRPIAAYNTLQGYHDTVQQLANFFLDRGFLEVDTQSRRSILAACEDPATIATYTFAGTKWPLPQTGQMWLEHELLQNPNVPGLFCRTTSYRDEPNPNPDRHLNMFPLFEFETHGNMDALQRTIEDLCEYLGLEERENFRDGNYKFVADYYGTEELNATQEMNIWTDFSPVFILKDFPFHTHPFFNMKKEGDHAKKIDAILYGMETIGSAERSCNVEEMRELFHTISHGMYAKLLFNHFGKERVLKELDTFLSYDFFPRFGGGIGVTRLIRAIELSKEKRGERAPTTAPFRQPTAQQMI
jgi:aspartyl/asparaginyl-tRNA synthetase